MDITRSHVKLKKEAKRKNLFADYRYDSLSSILITHNYRSIFYFHI